jgi:predicted kinase
MNERTLYLLCGLPGAGKTTRAHQIVDSVNALHLCPDDWIRALGISLLDYELRPKLQGCMLEHAKKLLRSGVSVVVEFGSWSRHERDTIREAGASEGARVELHFMDAPVEELARRARARGGPEDEALVSKVLLPDWTKFERPTADEIACFDRYVGPGDAWNP